MNKSCTKCKLVKPTHLFPKNKNFKDGLYSWCKDCKNADGRKFYNDNRDLVNARNRKAYSEDIENRRASIRKRRKGKEAQASKRSRKSYELNKAKNLLRNRENSKRRYKEDPVYKLRLDLSRGLREAFSGRHLYSKESKLYDVVGLTGLELVNYLWGTFESNYGIPRSWVDRKLVQIDHIIPKSQGKTEDEVRRLNHYANLQILFKEDNQSKHAKYCKGEFNESD